MVHQNIVIIYLNINQDSKTCQHIIGQSINRFYFINNYVLNLIDDTTQLHSRETYHHDQLEFEKIDEFRQNYTENLAIWSYTKGSCIYQKLNHVLRIGDIELTVEMALVAMQTQQVQQPSQAQQSVEPPQTSEAQQN
ncbi:hypothetical protein I4U23_004279 [Adineta vaga]|nr:hypothetical protein I4U23_004279 [Adineta vaga]